MSSLEPLNTGREASGLVGDNPLQTHPLFENLLRSKGLTQNLTGKLPVDERVVV
jgi:hypothetical protein